MNIKSIAGILSISLSCTVFSGAAQAAPILFNDSTDFLAAVTTSGAIVGTDTFDDLSHGGNLNTTSLARDAGAFSYTASSSISTLWSGATSDGFLTTDNMTSSIIFSGFSSPVNAFGMNVFGSDFGSFPVTGQSMQVQVIDVMSNVYSFLLEATTRATYLGFIGENSLSSINVSRTGSLWPSVDNLSLASAGQPSGNVPVPATLLLVLIGLSGIAGLRRLTECQK